MAAYFVLNSNRLTGAIPSQLGRLTRMTNWFSLSSNKLCGAVPPQVAALSSTVYSNWQIGTGNTLGTRCPTQEVRD
jgi:hypothetical protein